ncbi:MAG: hypothetical protein PWQ25_1173 [Deferribacteres bacterium]|jgi:cbb3-type cytochrome oxidase maturation protein|nr:hypothetical protein [Deferribacteres bacterium]
MGSLFFLVPLSLLLGIIVLILFFWAVKNKQFDDVEGPKYRMLDDDDE